MKQNKKIYKRMFLAAALVSGFTLTMAQASVVTSVRPLGFIASAIADGVTPTEILLPDGASPHDFALRPSDLQKMRSADLVVWVGPEMEAYMTKSAAHLPANRQVEIATLATVKPLLQKGDEEEGEGHDHQHTDGHDEHHHGEYNMHVWMSPEIAKQTAIAIHAKLLELMPQKKDKLDANLKQFEESL